MFEDVAEAMHRKLSDKEMFIASLIKEREELRAMCDELAGELEEALTWCKPTCDDCHCSKADVLAKYKAMTTDEDKEGQDGN